MLGEVYSQITYKKGVIDTITTCYSNLIICLVHSRCISLKRYIKVRQQSDPSAVDVMVQQRSYLD